MGWFQDGRPAEGQFIEKSNELYYEYRKTSNWWALKQNCPFEVAAGGNNEIRYAKIKKTVLYLAVDEDAEGNAVFEKWDIKHQWGVLK